MSLTLELLTDLAQGFFYEARIANDQSTIPLVRK